MSRRVRALSQRTYPWTNLDPDHRNAVLLVAGITLVVGLALGLIAYGYYNDRIAPKHASVLKVGNRNFSYTYLEHRTVAAYVNNEIKIDTTSNDAFSQSLSQGILTTFGNIQKEEETRQAAKAQGINATAQEIDTKLRALLHLGADAPPEQLAQALQAQLQRADLTLGQYREIATTQVLADKLRAQIGATVPAQAEQADIVLIETSTQDAANQAKQRLDNGDNFGVVAATMSVHTSKSKAGELGWVPRGALPSALEDVAFAQVGVSDIIQTDQGFFILWTREVQQQRDVTDDGKKAVVEAQLSELLKNTATQLGVESRLTTGQVQRLALKLSQASGS